MGKIFNLSELEKIVLKKKKQGKKFVLCHGVFDILHLGHLNYLKSAKKVADFLIVTLTTDKYIKKGFGRPFFNQKQRAEMLSSLKIVDFVSYCNEPSAAKAIKTIKPNFYAKGIEYKDSKNDLTKKIILEKSVLKKNKGKIVFINEPTFSSSKIINQTSNIFNTQQKTFLDKIKKNYSFAQIVHYLEKLKKLKVTILGELIIDRYIFCDALGKSGKEPYLAFKELFYEDYIGGSGAIARQLSEFNRNINLITNYGNDKFNTLINRDLNKTISRKFVYNKNSKNILKKRYIDNISRHKVFGSYKYDETNEQRSHSALLKIIKNSLKNSDLLIISDYGHGLINDKISSEICNSKKFISLNAQVNAANIGYHTIRKYTNIDSLIINETELRHELRDKISNVDALSKKLLKQMKIKNLVVTMGTNGALIMNDKFKTIKCPAFSSTYIDKVGAGDSMLGVMSLCLRAGMPNDLTLFLGSIIGGLSVQILGNKDSVKYDDFLRTIEFSIK